VEINPTKGQQGTGERMANPNAMVASTDRRGLGARGTRDSWLVGDGGLICDMNEQDIEKKKVLRIVEDAED
jgi:hypothetical protein